MEKIKKEIRAIEQKMEWEQESLDKAVEEFKEAAESYDAYQIEEFIPGKVAEIARCRAKLQSLAEQKNMLQYILKADEEA